MLRRLHLVLEPLLVLGLPRLDAHVELDRIAELLRELRVIDQLPEPLGEQEHAVRGALRRRWHCWLPRRWLGVVRQRLAVRVEIIAQEGAALSWRTRRGRGVRGRRARRGFVARAGCRVRALLIPLRLQHEGDFLELLDALDGL